MPRGTSYLPVLGVTFSRYSVPEIYCCARPWRPSAMAGEYVRMTTGHRSFTYARCVMPCRYLELAHVPTIARAPRQTGTYTEC